MSRVLFLLLFPLEVSLSCLVFVHGLLQVVKPSFSFCSLFR